MGVLAYFMLWLLAPLDRIYPVAWGSLAYIALGYSAFFAGCLLVAGGQRRVVPSQEGHASYTMRAFWTIALLGAFGMALRFYDKLFVRGISLADSALEARELLADAEAGPLAAVGGLFYPLCYVPLILWWARPASLSIPPWAKGLALVLFVLPALDALLLLSRSQMLVALAMMYFSGACVLYRGRVLHPRLVRPVAAGLIALAAISALVFSSRLSQMDLDVVFSILNSAYGFVLTPGNSALMLMSQGEGLLSQLTATTVPILQYYLHGLFEFGLLWGRPDAQVFTHGAQHFAPYVKALSIFHVIDYPDFGTDDLYYRSGVFTTFFGPLWTDFGWWGLLFMAGFGALAKHCAHLARRGMVSVMPLYAYFCVVMFFMPVVNFMISAQGMYIINAFVLVWWLMRAVPMFPGTDRSACAANHVKHSEA